jgi:hypothetical protein
MTGLLFIDCTALLFICGLAEKKQQSFNSIVTQKDGLGGVKYLQ